MKYITLSWAFRLRYISNRCINRDTSVHLILLLSIHNSLTCYYVSVNHGSHRPSLVALSCWDRSRGNNCCHWSCTVKLVLSFDVSGNEINGRDESWVCLHKTVMISLKFGLESRLKIGAQNKPRTILTTFKSIWILKLIAQLTYLIVLR